MTDTLPPPAPPSPLSYVPPPKDQGIALILELVPGMFLQTFGIGNLYAGNLGWGLVLMFGYWIAAWINFLLLFVLVGLVTWPITWLAFAAVASYLAANKARQTQGAAPIRW
jgi:TM2 domain-containing membrane protein YozV